MNIPLFGALPWQRSSQKEEQEERQIIEEQDQYLPLYGGTINCIIKKIEHTEFFCTPNINHYVPKALYLLTIEFRLT